MIVTEVWHRVLTTCLMRTDELVMDIVWGHCFVISLPILGLPCNVKNPFVARFCGRKYLQHGETIEKPLPLRIAKCPIILPDSRLGHDKNINLKISRFPLP